MAKNLLVWALNKPTRESLNGQLLVVLRNRADRGDLGSGTGDGYSKMSPQKRWETA